VGYKSSHTVPISCLDPSDRRKPSFAGNEVKVCLDSRVLDVIYLPPNRKALSYFRLRHALWSSPARRLKFAHAEHEVFAVFFQNRVQALYEFSRWLLVVTIFFFALALYTLSGGCCSLGPNGECGVAFGLPWRLYYSG
jgi:hypothetical protein